MVKVSNTFQLSTARAVDSGLGLGSWLVDNLAVITFRLALNAPAAAHAITF